MITSIILFGVYALGLLGIDGMEPRFAKAMLDEGKMPHL